MTTFASTDALLLVAHGTVDKLDDLAPFLAVIRRGHAASPELLAEVRRRYEAIGGRSPLNDICHELTRKLGAHLGVRAAYAGRLWGPKPAEVLAQLAAEGVTRVFVVPLAQHSASIYVDSVRAAAATLTREGPAMTILGPANWGQTPGLTALYAASLAEAIDAAPREGTHVLFTAHSLPIAVIRGGDPYETEFRASAASVAAATKALPPHELIFQSQGMSGGEWLGPDVKTTLDRLAKEGVKHVLFAPVGFLADHVEVLYDLDIEAKGWAEERGLGYSRTKSLNASDGLVEVLASVALSVVLSAAAQ